MRCGAFPHLAIFVLLAIPTSPAYSQIAPAVSSQAGSIVYLDANHDVWVTSPDGVTKHRITSDGATQHYVSPSETDAGIIVASGKQAFFHYFNQDGSKARGPFTVLDIACPSIDPPFTSQVNPQGTMVVYYYLDAPGCVRSRGFRVAFANTNSLTGKGVYDQWWGSHPRWVPGTNYAAYVSEQGSQLETTNSHTQESVWIRDSKGGLRSFDISRTGNKVLIARASSTDPRSRSDLLLWQNKGTPPASGSAVCAVPGWGENDEAGRSIPRWSPDATQFTWSDSRGVWVSPAPVAGTSGECVIHPKLIVPGGSSPDWGLPNAGAKPRGTTQR
jgi:hypothetical protein